MARHRPGRRPRSRRPASTTRRSSVPRRLWPLYEKVLRHAAGLGTLPREQAEREWRTEYRRRHADVLVVGGGVAGLAAAIAAAELGADVVLVDEGPSPAARLLVARAATSRLGSWPTAPARPASRSSRRRRRSATSTGSSPSGRATRCTRSAPASYVYATGAIEQPLVFAGNDLPGVMLSGGARAADRALRRQARRRAPWSPRPPTAGSRAALALHAGRGRDRGRRRPAHRADAVAPRGSRAPGSRCCTAGRWSRPRGGRRAPAPCSPRWRASRRRRAERGSSSATWWSSPAASAPATSLPLQAGATHRYDAPAATSRSTSCPPACAPPARSPARAATAAERSGELAGLEAARARARRRDERRARRARARARTRPAPATPCRRAVRRRRRGGKASPASARTSPPRTSALASRRATTRSSLQALHDGDDGPVPGPHVPAPGDPADGRRDRRSARATSARRPPARRGRRCRWACSPAARSSRPSARRSTPATASWARSVKWAGDWRRAVRLRRPARARRWPSTVPPG